MKISILPKESLERWMKKPTWMKKPFWFHGWDSETLMNISHQAPGKDFMLQADGLRKTGN